MQWRVEKYSLADIKSWIRTKELRVPKIQRSLVWSENQKERLMDTITKGLPFGSITLHEKEGKKYIIDGLQRTTTLLGYYNRIESNVNFGSIKNIVNDEKNNEIFNDKRINYGDAQIRKLSDEMVKYDILTCDRQTLNNHITDIVNECPDIDKRDLKDIIMELRERHNELREISIPAIVYTGSDVGAARLFKRINEQGVPLTELEKLSTDWTKYKITINNDRFDTVLSGKYKSILDSSLAIEEVDTINPTEVIYYIMHEVFSKTDCVIGNKFYSHNRKEEVINMQEFLLFLRATLDIEGTIDSVDVGQKITVMGNCFKNVEEYISNIKEAVRVLKNKAPILTMNGNVAKYKLSNLKVGTTLISTYLAHIYRKMFIDNVNVEDIHNIDAHIVADIVDGTFSSNSSESGVLKIKEKAYDQVLSFDEMWKRYDNFFDKYLHDAPSKTPFDVKARALMYLVYSRIIKSVSLASLEYQLDHIIPKSDLKSKKIYGVRNFANLSFLEARKNLKKSDEYNSKFINMDPITKNNESVIGAYNNFVANKTDANYKSFCDARLKAIKEKLKNNYNLNE